MLEHLFYEGEKKGFIFEKFLENHSASSWKLERHGEPVLESKKIHDFLEGQLPELQAAIQMVRIIVINYLIFNMPPTSLYLASNE